MDKMDFSVDKQEVTEGDIVQVTWQCNSADRVELTLDNGHRTSVIPLELAGSKRFRLNRSKGRTRLTITAWVGDKNYSKTLKVKVKEIPVTRAETVDALGRRQWVPQHWVDRLRTSWQSATARRRMALRALPPEKQMASRTLMVLGAIMLVTIFFPRLASVGLLALAAYLLWVLWKR